MDRGRVVSGDYRGFVMIWDMEDIEEEMRQFDRKQRKKVDCTLNSLNSLLDITILCCSHRRV